MDLAKQFSLKRLPAEMQQFWAHRERGAIQIGEGEFAGAPSLAELGQFGVVRPDAVEAIRQPLYDFTVYPNAGSLQLQFFQLPQGQGTSASPGNAGNAKVLSDTNMEAAGQLPAPKAFLATSIEVIITPGATSAANNFLIATPAQQVGSLSSVGAVGGNLANDVNAIAVSGFLDFFVISKSYVQVADLQSFPPKHHVELDAAFSTADTDTAVGATLARAVGRPFYLNPPVLLLPNTNFRVTLNWPVVVATPSGLNARIGVRLDGFLYRNAQ